MKKATSESTQDPVLQDFSFPGTPVIPSVTIRAESIQDAEAQYAEYLKKLRDSEE